MFSDHMVIQQGLAAPVWGWAAPGEQITVRFAGQVKRATADAQGRWEVKLAPLTAKLSRGELVLGIEGKNKIAIRDVLIGEVWVCSGQSNMWLSPAASMNAAQEVAAADFPQIRLFTVPHLPAGQPLDTCTGVWTACSPESVAGFSAVGYFFGRSLYRDLKVPIGLIHTSAGGTPAEFWVSAPALRAKLPEFDQDLDQHTGASALFNGMINPLIPFGIRGAIWYQGESNVDRPAQYRKLLPTLIADWRTHWGEGDFPFGIVSLANYIVRPDQTDSGWAELREAQALTAERTPNCGLAETIDIGEAGSIHPTNKQEVGRRLALWAEGTTYGLPVVYSGPVYQAMQVEGSKIVLSFTHTERGLVAQGGPLTGFALCGPDQKFVSAQAQIQGNKVVVWADAVAQPVAVRYAWADNPACNLYNGAGLPTVPFRTDHP
jgi:sialate O-acetylesterase